MSMWENDLESISEVDISRIVEKLREYAAEENKTDEDIYAAGVWLAFQLREACKPEED